MYLSCSHAIVSTSVGPEYYVNILSFVDKSQLEPGCSILLHNKVGLPQLCQPFHLSHIYRYASCLHMTQILAIRH